MQKWSQIGRDQDVEESMLQRQEFLEDQFKVDTGLFAAGADLVGKIENTVGCMQLPLGVVGPVKLIGDAANGEFYLPMVTTETCLVASCQRGAKLFAEGIEVKVEQRGLTRAAVLRCASAAGARSVAKFLEDNIEVIKEKAEDTSSYLELLEIRTTLDEDLLHFMLVARTGEAMGMNMITIAMKNVLDEFVLKEAPVAIELIAESGNWCSDKKPSIYAAENGRGRTVKAEGFISAEQLEELGVTCEDLETVVNAKMVSGSKQAGSMSQNAHHANMVAAFYAATGQDLAHTVEGSLGSTVVECKDDGAWFEVELPAVLVGSVGGGTALPQVKELFKLMKVESGKDGSADKLAALLGALVLCGEASLIIALAKSELASSHADRR